MYPRLERFLATLAVAAIVVTAAFWAFPPELRFPDPKPEADVPRPEPVETPAAPAPSAAPLPAPPQTALPMPPAGSESPVQAAAIKPEETGEGMPSVISRALREALPAESLSDEQLRELTESIQTFRESMQTLREAERTAENAERIRELMGRIEENRRRFEAAAGMSINDFLQRTTTDGIDNDRREDDKTAPDTLARPGR
jgi:hypothetical protein